jgi:hypothetical protein
MYPVIPPEMISGAVQLAVYFVATVGVLVGLMLTARA